MNSVSEVVNEYNSKQQLQSTCDIAATESGGEGPHAMKLKKITEMLIWDGARVHQTNDWAGDKHARSSLSL